MAFWNTREIQSRNSTAVLSCRCEDLDSFTEWVILDFCLDFAISPRYHESSVEKLNYAP
jgi:hypothetical protein